VKAFLHAPLPDGTDPSKEEEKRWQDLCQTLLASADFRMID
jgi:hypothetical protein